MGVFLFLKIFLGRLNFYEVYVVFFTPSPKEKFISTHNRVLVAQGNTVWEPHTFYGATLSAQWGECPMVATTKKHLSANNFQKRVRSSSMRLI